MTQAQIQLVKKLTIQEQASIQQLIAMYHTTYGWRFKVDPNNLEHTDAENISHFLVRTNDNLVAYMLTAFYNKTELEVTIVGSDTSNFKILFDLALKEANNHQLSTLLLVIDPSDHQTVLLAKKAGMEHGFSEFRLALTNNRPPISSRPEVSLRQATTDDKIILEELDTEGFGESASIALDDIPLCYLAEVNQQVIGKVRLEQTKDTVGIFGFVVSPAERGKGYGTEILSRIIQEKLAAGFSYIYLEVALANPSALKLYERSGFEKEATFDYYQLKIASVSL